MAQVPTKKLLILGDSLTEGFGVAKDSAFPQQLQKILDAKGYKIKVISAGSSGSTSASAMQRLKWHLQTKPDFLLLALGGNDGLRGLKPEVTYKNLDQAIKLAKSKGIKVFLAGMKMPTNYGQEYRSAFEKTFQDLSLNNSTKLIPFLLEGVAGQQELNQADQIHPNEKGHVMIAETVFKSLKESL